MKSATACFVLLVAVAPAYGASQSMGSDPP
jgi:hypothetical protein